MSDCLRQDCRPLAATPEHLAFLKEHLGMKSNHLGMQAGHGHARNETYESEYTERV